MTFHRRKLPHIYEIERPGFVTWRLQGSLPPGRGFTRETVSSGQAFAAMDRLLDNARTGPMYLNQTPVAQMVVDAIHCGAGHLGKYELHEYVVMSNHVHLLLTPRVVLSEITRSLKGFTARQANATLGLTGQAFWEPESYDRVVRNDAEFERIHNYIQQNPVRAGIVQHPEDYPWCGAGGDREVARRSGDPPYRKE